MKLHRYLWAVPLLPLLIGVVMRLPSPQDGEWTQADLEQATEEIKRDVERLRGASFLRPVKVEITDKEGFFDYAMKRVAATTPPERMAADETIAKMLGLLPPDMDLLQESMRMLEDQVGGFYDPETESFYLMQGFTGGIARVILAHELAHALDDQLYDIDGLLDPRLELTDESMAFQAVVEGSGTAVMNRWMLDNMGSIDLSGFEEMQASQTDSLANAPMALWKPMLAVYLAGASFLAKSESVLAGQLSPAGNSEIEAAFKAPPRSTEQILHPAKYWSESERDEPRQVRHEIGRLPRDWELLRRDRLGEMTLAILALTPESRAAPDFSNPMAMIAVEFTNDVAAGWGGDEVVLLGKGDARFLRFVSVWDSGRDAGEFFGAMYLLLPSLRQTLADLAAGERSGAKLEYGDGDDEVVLELFFGARRSDVRKIGKALTLAAD